MKNNPFMLTNSHVASGINYKRLQLITGELSPLGQCTGVTAFLTKDIL